MNNYFRKFCGYVLIFTIWFFSLSSSHAQDGKAEKNVEKSLKVLTIGNSFADNAVTFLPQIAASVPGYQIVVTKANLGGCSLERHVSLIQACEADPENKTYAKKYCLKELLQMDDYDFVTIQQVSSLSFKADSFEPYAGELVRFIRENEPQAEIIIQQTWAYPNPGRLEEWGITYDGMHTGLVESYNLLAENYSIRIMPVGEAFYHAHQTDPDMDLWNNDRHHANVNGCYLAGCVWFGKMADVSPQKVKFIPKEMDKKTARFLRKTADRVIERQHNKK